MRELDALDRYIADHPTRAFFRPPASPEAIASLEAYLGRPLPTPHRAFLRRHDGGFIAADFLCEESGRDVSTEAWNSVRFMSVEEIREESGRFRRPSAGPTPSRAVEYIPCVYGLNQEPLVFDGAAPLRDDPPILDAFHESRPADWGVVSETFAAFLDRYVQEEGDVDTVATG